MDLFMLLCTFFVFLSLIEFFAVSAIIRSQKKSSLVAEADIPLGVKSTEARNGLEVM